MALHLEDETDTEVNVMEISCQTHSTSEDSVREIEVSDNCPSTSNDSLNAALRKVYLLDVILTLARIYQMLNGLKNAKFKNIGLKSGKPP